MVDDTPGEPMRIRRNVGIEGAEVRAPEVIPGALPENAGDHKAEAVTVPREGVVRLPEATVEALAEEELE